MKTSSGATNLPVLCSCTFYRIRFYAVNWTKQILLKFALQIGWLDDVGFLPAVNVFTVWLVWKVSVCLGSAAGSLCDQSDARCQRLNQSGSECLWNTSPSFGLTLFFLSLFKKIPSFYTPLFFRVLVHLQAASAISRLLFNSHGGDKPSSCVRLSPPPRSHHTIQTCPPGSLSLSLHPTMAGFVASFWSFGTEKPNEFCARWPGIFPLSRCWR